MRVDLIRSLTRRVAFAIVLVYVLASSAMLLARLAPGDAASELLGRGLSEATLEAERARYGLDQSVLEHYREWLGRAARLDLGTSLRYGRPVGELVGERAVNTAILAASALILATLVGVPLGVVSGSRRGTRLAALIGNASTVSISLPPLLLSLGLAFLAVRTGWFPVGGMIAARVAESGAASRAFDVLWHLVLPSVALALPLAATLERIQSQAIEEVLGEPFMRCAASRGLPRSRLIWRHALRASSRPVLAVYGIIVGSLLSGSFAVEIVMAWPGLGRLTYDALLARDVHLVAGCAAAGALFVTAGVLGSDVVAWVADPRAREAAA